LGIGFNGLHPQHTGSRQTLPAQNRDYLHNVRALPFMDGH
jgi:hypothetical protein